MKILLLGANGQVGQELWRSLTPLGDIVAATRSGTLPDGAPCEPIDLANLDAIGPLFERIAPDVVVNAAAYTAVDRAEGDADLAFRANADVPRRLAELCAQRGATLLHYSTDYVFDGGGSRPYREDDRTAPLGVYGASKLAGEQALRASGCHYLILRTAWVYAMHGHNFLRTMLRLGGEREELSVVADQVGSPTPAWLIADVTAAILAQGLREPGVRHLVAGGHTTWHGFAEAIFADAHARGLIARSPRVRPIITADYPTPAQRPAYGVLDTTRLRDEYALELPPWRDALQMTLDRPVA